MPDWSLSMQQTYEYYVVDPGTWQDVKMIDIITSSSIDWDTESNTLGSATINIADTVGEMYIRIYLITIQNGVKEKHALGTFLVQTPSFTFDGITKDVSMDAYTPLLELNEKHPPIGYFVPKGSNIMDEVYNLVKNNTRAPVVKPSSDQTLYSDFVADTSDTWLTFLIDLMTNAKFIFGLDEMGRILFLPKQDTASLQPVWTYDDGNSSILYPSISMNQDLYGIPNVVEIVCSTNEGVIQTRKINNDPNSPTSIISRGREIVHRETDPNIVGTATKERVEEYAETLLRELSSIEYKISYSHGYCPVRIGDCVRLNYERAGLTNIKARVIDQSINCKPGCPVSETAVFTKKLWG